MIAAYCVLIALTVIWGFTFPVVQDSLAYASPLVFVTVRFALAALIFPLLAWPRAFRLNRRVILQGLWLGVLLWGGFAFQTFGLGHTTAARSGFLTGTLVPMTPLFAWLLFRLPISLRLWMAVAFATVGTVVMSRPEAGGLNLGDVLTLFCAASFALQVVFVSRWGRRENEIQLTWLQILVAGALAAMSMPLEGPRLDYDPYLGRALLFTAVPATAFALWAQLRYQPRVSPAAAAVIYALEPVTAAVASWILQGHVPPRTTLYGAAFIVAGMILSSQPPPRKALAL